MLFAEDATHSCTHALTSHLRATMLQQCTHRSLRHRILRAAVLQLLQLLLAAPALQRQ